MINFACPSCGKRFSVPDDVGGRAGQCKACGTALRVPAARAKQEEIVLRVNERAAPRASQGATESPAATPRAMSAARGVQPPNGPPVPSAPAAASPPSAKLPMRIRRLMADAEQVRKAFGRFPLIRLRAAQGDPPERYEIEYHLRGLARGPSGGVIYRDQHVAEIQLTREYPRQAPKCKMLTPVFHPNIEPSSICVGDHWTAAERLVDLILRIGEMIAFQAYNIKSPLDGEAAMWADQNIASLPIDPRDLRPPGLQ